jgi:hypothetical protein
VASFNLPPKLISQNVIEGETIREFILRDNGLREAAETLSLSIFMPNPLDCLYYIYLCLTQIKTGALKNLKENCDGAEGADITLSFDDTFSLFWAVFLASDVVDIFPLQRFITDLAPKQLSSIFEYSKMILEALAMHLREVDMSAMGTGVC